MITLDLIKYNEYDEILELKIKPKGELTYDSYMLFKGKFTKVLMTQNGSRVLQAVLKNTKPDIISKVFNEIVTALPTLIVDSYANYFCQKFFTLLNIDERCRFLARLKSNFVNVACNKIGTYPLQSIIEQLNESREKEILLDMVKDSILELSYDTQGTHVVEKVIISYDENVIDSIYKTIINNFYDLAININGLCVCKKAIIHSNNLDNLEMLRGKIYQNALPLIQNTYGNYVIQTAYENWNADFCEPISTQFYGKFYILSLQKFSSNVIEKLLETCNYEVVSIFINEVSSLNRIMELIKSSYGNYVIQKALRAAKGEEKEKFVHLIKKNLHRMNDKKIIKKWKNIINDVTANTNTIDDTLVLPSLDIASSLECFSKFNEEYVNRNDCYFKGHMNGPFFN
jgi:hypothetical protein